MPKIQRFTKGKNFFPLTVREFQLYKQVSGHMDVRARIGVNFLTATNFIGGGLFPEEALKTEA